VYTRDGYLITVVKHEIHVHSEAVKETLEILDELSKNE
jgi:hypothetical protein